MSVDEVRSGVSVYRDAFFAEVTGEKRHPRAPIPELKELLLPKRNNPSMKDQVAHWYEAQLVHYGLPRTKDKNVAKVRLTTALTSGILAVPSSVQQIEADLKKEYANARRRVRNTAKKEVLKPPQSTSVGRKRKVGEENDGEVASITNLRVKVGDLTFEIDHQTARSPHGKKQKTTTQEDKGVSSVKKPRTGRSTPSASKSKSQGSPRSSPLTAIRMKNVPSKTSTVPKQTARRSKPLKPSASSSFTGRPFLSTAFRDSDVDEDGEPPPPYSMYVEQDDHQDTYNDNNHVVQISGFYPISTSATNYKGTLSVRFSNPRDQLWARFNIGDKSGVVRIDGIDGIGQSVRKSLGWRSEYSETGELRFGKGCDGWIEFDGDGAVRGVFYNLMARRDVEFDGHMEEDFGYEDDYERTAIIDELVSEWHRFPDRAYGRR